MKLAVRGIWTFVSGRDSVRDVDGGYVRLCFVAW